MTADEALGLMIEQFEQDGHVEAYFYLPDDLVTDPTRKLHVGYEGPTLHECAQAHADAVNDMRGR